MRHWITLLLVVAASAQRQPLSSTCACPSQPANQASQQGIEAHLKRRLEEASLFYSKALQLEPPRDASEADRALILRFTPRVFTTPNDPFALKDAAAVLHPNRRWIAYHFFWEDDIDFPDDNDPCDHELMWVQLDPSGQRVRAYFTYFHGRILEAPAASLEDAAQHQGRPAIVVQWGKHGSMPLDWRNLSLIADSGDIERKHLPVDSRLTLEAYNRATFEKLTTVGRQAQDSPLSRGWPLKFPGAWNDFTSFSVSTDVAGLLRSRAMMKVSCLNNAVINRHFLRYNFAAKTEWPAALCEMRR
ncbi:MAG: hypothetical protein JJE04_06585 [Acidobacteriia bacterium]|nr:hypothetical protein [Terriglobia bacterium]